MTTISVVIPVFNEEQYLKQCLISLKRQVCPNFDVEIIVVDNGSTDSSLSIAKSYTNNVFRITDVNVGAVRNFGVLKAKGSIIAFIDADCTVKSDWLATGVTLLSEGRKRIIGGSLFLRVNPNWVERCWILQRENATLKQTHLLGSCIIVMKSDFTALGGFDESVTSGEDSDFSSRAKKENFNVQIHRQFGVVHLGNPTTLPSFINRQIWHAENYMKKFPDTASDATFWFVIIFLIGTCLLIGSILGFQIPWLIPILLLLGPACILSVKRMYRNRYSTKSILELCGILVLDLSYLAGRMLGTIKSIGVLSFNYYRSYRKN